MCAVVFCESQKEHTDRLSGKSAEFLLLHSTAYIRTVHTHIHTYIHIQYTPRRNSPNQQAILQVIWSKNCPYLVAAPL